MVRVFVFFVALAGAAFFAANNAATFETALAGLREASVAPIAAGVILSAVAIVNRGFLNRAAHVAVGLHARPFPMARTAAVGFAANKIVRSAGASGLAVFVRNGTRLGYAPSRVAGACMVAAAASFFSLGFLVFVNLVVLAASDRLSAWWLTAGAGFLVYSALIAAGVVAARRRRDTARRLWARCRDVVGRLRRRPLNGEPVGLDDLYEAMAAARANSSWSSRVLVHAIASKLLGAAMLLAAAAATGLPISMAGVLLIYTTALVASLFSIVPGGLGMVEATTAAMFVSAGAPLTLAVVAVALFRIFDLWIPVVTGALFAKLELRSLTSSPAASHATDPSQTASQATAPNPVEPNRVEPSRVEPRLAEPSPAVSSGVRPLGVEILSLEG